METRTEDLDLLGLGLDRVLDIFPPELQKEVLDLYLEKKDRSGKFCCSFNNNLLWFRYIHFTKGLVVKADGSWPRGRGFKPQQRILDGCKR